MPDGTNDQVERALRQVGVALRARPAPDVASAVRAALEAETARQPQRNPRWRGPLAATLAAIALALVPGVRGAVADLIDAIPGITLNPDHGSTLPVDPPVSEPGAPLGAPLGLVGETDLATARASVAYDLPLPAGLGEPESVYVRAGVVTMIWPAGPGLPALEGSDVGLVLDVVDGSHGPVFEKLLLGVEVEWLEIDGAPAAWVGAPHPLVVVNADGVPDRSHDRIAARTLLLSATTTIRLESMLTREQAIEVVRSFSYARLTQ